eukprot:TRINITY_DN3344_c0_g2_i1.p1 TRINITY_DN3344_c0_g2~~TRINITY_DN3344_c0_g2_i1.p1  ORF type:complete len:137 (+),score=45.89 TRINITY_DN3344_c0_g2_i1:474-884(+)
MNVNFVPNIKSMSERLSIRGVGDSPMESDTKLSGRRQRSSSKKESSSTARKLKGNSNEEGALKVVVRVRPLSQKEINEGHTQMLDVVGENVIVVKDETIQSTDYLRVNRSKEKQFAFDLVFGESASQEDVFNSSTK